MKIKSQTVELKHLRGFEAVAGQLSFTRAAEVLNIAQSALSKQIRELEELLGVDLFVRNRVKVRLTEAGKAYLPYATKILAQMEIAATAAIEAAKENSSQLTIGTDWRVTHPKVIAAIVAFKKKYPQVDLEIMDLPMPDQADALREGVLDLAFLPKGKFNAETPEDEVAQFAHMRRKKISGIVETPIARCEMKVVVSVLHPLAEAEMIPLIDLSKERWVTLDGRDNDGYRAFMRGLCRAAGFTPNFYKGAKNLQSLIGLVGNQQGVCTLPDFVMPHDTPMVKAIKTNVEPMELAAVYFKEKGELKLVQQFLELLLDG